jgi:hypothetical protein
MKSAERKRRYHGTMMVLKTESPRKIDGDSTE